MNKNTRGEIQELTKLALNVRRSILRMIKAGGAGHVGGALSVTDILTALYFHIMNVDPDNPKMEDRDRLVLSAGHKCLALYAVLAERGFFPKDILDTYGSLKSRLPGHPDMHELPGVEANTGALGHGLSIAGGMAMGLRMSGFSSRVFVVMGDGELAEGSNWEAAAAISHHRLDNIICIVDRNRLQIGGETTKIMNYEPLALRWGSFGWEVRNIDGHNLGGILETLEAAPFQYGKPSLIIADTVKSKGLSFAEDRTEYHYWKAKPEELVKAEEDLKIMKRYQDDN